MRLGLLLLLGVGFAWVPGREAHAGMAPCLSRVLLPERKSSVELELDIYRETPEVLEMLTTVNGKVSGVLGSLSAPVELVEWARVNRPVSGNPGDLDWESLPLEIRHAVLKRISTPRIGSFFSNRSVIGMKMKDRLKLHFREPTEFDGKHYEAGIHQVDVHGMFGAVEYADPSDMAEFSGIEVHFMSSRSAGTATQDAWNLLDALDIVRPHQHVHTVAKLPLEEMRAHPTLEVTRMMEYWLRANLMAEILAIRAGGTLLQIPGEFGSVTRPRIDSVQGGLNKSLVSGNTAGGGYNSKLSMIAMRGGTTYSEPGLWGFEYRAITAHDDPRVNGMVLDSIQWSMVNRDYGLSKEEVSSWIGESTAPETVWSRLSNSWYNLHDESMPMDANPAFQSILSGQAPRHNELYMLVHDWSTFPLLAGRPQVLAATQIAQAHAKAALVGGAPINEVMNRFLTESKIDDAVSDSMNLPRFEPH